ncbi:MAG: redoxin family protein [Verrucomicrobia bacterium]|nr:redoxin family protein [Verrucomicrobiota bacterium]
MHRISSFLAAIALAAFPAAAAPALKVGDPAPAIKVGKWFKGQPVEKFDPSQVYVVEFWATWCGPCKKNIPHLTELAKKYEGKARILGISIFEPEKTDHQKRLDLVGKFVTAMGDKMDYIVAADDNDGFMAKNWMEAAGEQGIPTAFIVGKDGRIAWIGYPWQGMDENLAAAVAGTLDMEAMKADAAKRQREKDEKAAVSALFKPAQELQAQGKTQEALAALDQLEAAHPELAGGIGGMRFRLLLSTDGAAACREARRLLEGPLKNNHNALYTMTRDLTEPAGLTNIDWEVPVALATRAVELSNGAPNTLFVLAHAYYRKGDFAKAVATAEQAVAKSAADPDSDPQSIAFMKGMLEKYRAAAAK